jgi:hypothetical protein
LLFFTLAWPAAGAVRESKAEIQAVLNAISDRAAGTIESITREKDGAYFVKIRESSAKCFALRFHLQSAPKKPLRAVADAREYDCEK